MRCNNKRDTSVAFTDRVFHYVFEFLRSFPSLFFVHSAIYNTALTLRVTGWQKLRRFALKLLPVQVDAMLAAFLE
jgi:hypothetical protein